MAPAATAGDDWYRITLPPLTTLVATLEFTHANSDLDLVLVDPVTATRLASSSSVTNAETVRLNTRVPTSREVLLVVVNYGRKNNSYRLTLDTSTLSPPTNDTCAAAVPLTPGTSVTGDTANSLNDLALAYPSCGVFGTGGGDVFYGVTLAAGAQATFTLQSPADLALILLENCAAPCCWASADRYVANNTETLQFTNPTGAPLNLVLAVDGTQSGTFELRMETP